MKSKLTINPTNPVRKYPYLGVTKNNCVVLFREYKTGMVVKEGTYPSHTLGYYCNEWLEDDCFTPLVGMVELSND